MPTPMPTLAPCESPPGLSEVAVFVGVAAASARVFEVCEAVEVLLLDEVVVREVEEVMNVVEDVEDV